VTELKLVDPIEPLAPTKVVGEEGKWAVDFEHYRADLKEYLDRIRVYSDFRASLYAVVFGQCTEAMKNRIQSHDDF
jgi:hypothetical protein